MLNFVKNKDPPLVNGRNPNHDVSYDWISKDLNCQLIEKGIATSDFKEKTFLNRNLDFEFRVIIVFINS